MASFGHLLRGEGLEETGGPWAVLPGERGVSLVLQQGTGQGLDRGDSGSGELGQEDLPSWASLTQETVWRVTAVVDGLQDYLPWGILSLGKLLYWPGFGPSLGWKAPDWAFLDLLLPC